MNISEAIKTGSKELRSTGIADPVREASLLLQLALNCDAAFLFAHPESELGSTDIDRFAEAITRRSTREPYQHIAGKQEFYGLDFTVTPDVLIPRPETEILVEAVIEKFRTYENLRFIELGAGSGCIAVSLLANLPNAKGRAVDISEKALTIAKINAESHDVHDRLELRLSNVFDGVNETGFDFIVSNPPYIPDGDIGSLQPEVRDHEPLSALAGGSDGLDIVRSIVENSPRYLKPGGCLVVEIGWDQAGSVERLFDLSIWKNVRFLNDLQGIERIVSAELR